MNTHTSFHSVGELDQLRELTRGGNTHNTQLKPGTLNGFVSHANLGLSSFHLVHFSLPLRARGAYSSDWWTFLAPAVGAEGGINAWKTKPNSMFAFSPNAELEATTSDWWEQWSFTMKFGELSRVCEALSQRECLLLSSRVAMLQPDPVRLDRLRSFASAAMSLTTESPGLLNDARIREALHARLVELLAQTLLSASSVPPRRGKQDSHWRIVRTAEEFAHASLDRPIVLSDLCSLTDVSERTLRSAFLNVVGLTPNKYLRIIRLNRVRAELQRSSPGLTSVTSAAMRWGFVHLGRFAQDYKQFFGESPSETISEVAKIEPSA